jgi:uncharacterized protein (TIGR01777 family)
MRVAITGASGLLGSALVPFLRNAGHDVVRLVRLPAKAADEIRWDPAGGTVDAAALEGVDAAVNLSGENLAAGRWTEARRARLRSSRLGPTRVLAEALRRLNARPKVLVSVSAVGYYGDRGDDWLTEADPPGRDFLACLTAEWENAAEPAAAAGIRVVHPRLAMVLSPTGGALGKMLLPFKAGLGGVLGPGTQYVSWVAIDDVLEAFRHLLEQDDLAGPVNVAAPEPVTNRTFTKTLGRVLGRPAVTLVPAFALRLAYGEMAEATVLSSMRVRCDRLLASGYRFRFPTLEGALRHVVHSTARVHSAARQS